MEEIAILFVFGGLFLILSGPAALVISIIALNKVNSLLKSAQQKGYGPPAEAGEKMLAGRNEWAVTTGTGTDSSIRDERQQVSGREQEGAGGGQEGVKIGEQMAKQQEDTEQEDIDGARAVEPEGGPAANIYETRGRTEGGLELTIGTRWVLAAGAVTLLAGMAFFVKFAYDNWSIGPVGRIAVCAGAGLFGLLAGEITRRLGYDFTAKGTTAIGFGLLYTAVFAGYRLYGLLPGGWSFAAAIIITAAAAVYAAVLNEQLIGLLSLAGGFLTPLLVSTGENLPNQLFGYLFIISGGMMICSYIRKWRLIDAAAFAGVVILYTGWFEKYYYTWQVSESVRIFTALGWYGLFFALFTLRSVSEPLLKKYKAHPLHLCVIAINAVYACYILHEVLYDDYRMVFGHAVMGLAVLHAGFMISAYRRCREDWVFIDVLLAVVLFYPTLAVSVYLDGSYWSLAWSVEFAVLAVMSMRIKRLVMYVASGCVLILSWSILWFDYVPLHRGSFRAFANEGFINWAFLGVCMLLVQGFYRAGARERKDVFYRLAGVLYATGLCLLGLVCSVEWYQHCWYNLSDAEGSFYLTGQLLIVIFGVGAFSVRPVSVDRGVCLLLLGIWSVIGTVFAVVYGAFGYEREFWLFVNPEFGVSLLLGVSFLAGSFSLTKGWHSSGAKAMSKALTFLGILYLWVLVSEQIYIWFYCRGEYGEGPEQWFSAGHMYVSVYWAFYAVVLMTAGFILKLKMLRYISLGIFGCLLFKILVFDMQEIESVYRILAFVITGVVLVGVSFGYQHLKKKGYFELTV